MSCEKSYIRKPLIYPVFIFAVIFFSIFYEREILTKEIIVDGNSAFKGISDLELNRIGLLKLREKEFADAKKYFLSAIKKNPSVKYYYNNTSVAYINLRDYKSAYRYLLVAIAIDPNYVKALSNMAVTCFYQLRFREAYSYYLRAKSVDNGYTDERFEYDRVIKRIEKLRDEKPDNEEIEMILLYLKNKERIK